MDQTVTKHPLPKSGVLRINPYVPGGSKIEGRAKVIKLASNESPLGPSPKAVEAVKNCAENMHLYPDAGCADLRAVLGKTYDVNPQHIVCTAGSEQFLALVTQAFCGPGDEVIQSKYGFMVYRIATNAAGADIRIAEDRDYHTDVGAILKLVTDKTRIVFLDNPNNPTGTMISGEEVARLRASLPDTVLLVIDAAYAEYVNDPAYSDGHDLVMEAIKSGKDNVVVSHTFSKIYGLAAARVGWAYGAPTVIDAVNRVRGAFNVSVPAQKAAIAALEDTAHTQKARAHNDQWLPVMTKELSALGLGIPESAGNFVLAAFPEGEMQALEADSFLRDKGIIVRPVGGYGLGHCLRITIGRGEENEALLKVMKEFMTKAS